MHVCISWVCVRCCAAATARAGVCPTIISFCHVPQTKHIYKLLEDASRPITLCLSRVY